MHPSDLARQTAQYSVVPYSGNRRAAVLVLSDGSWVPGVRVESGSFSLTIPRLLNAFSTLIALDRTDLVSLSVNTPFTDDERLFVTDVFRAVVPRPNGDAPGVQFDAAGLTASLASGNNAGKSVDNVEMANKLSPFVGCPTDPADGVRLARRIAERALVPESSFPVGCIAATESGCVPGVNVEFADWSRILCAERNALGTIRSYNLPPPSSIFLSCVHDSTGSPCGACRQLLSELAPGATLWMDRAGDPPEQTTPQQLLPFAFAAHGVPRRID